ncbi:Hsp70 family protein [Corallincola platygyrae]|uniref:Hsp70 family protein n=1 Tax=Corallincola platygyrae TaxID=1193278 RepID=A0ABW4XTY7_9GAMM
MNQSSSNSAKYVVGIDLGTSNIVVAYAPLDTQKFHIWPIPQWLDRGQWGSADSLPAVRYHFGSELAASDQELPWPKSTLQTKLPPAIFGRWAQSIGTTAPNRLVSSAKSWLCQPQQSIGLPEKSDTDIAQVTPLEAVASYLDYLHCAWNFEFPEAPLSEQQIQITVPASFDEHARALTLEAAQMAGLAHPMLLEEPLAAAYDWLLHNPEAEQLAQCKQLLVCDIGGGTSDFSLINVEPDPDANFPNLARHAVGEHLMLGGDNIDLALARQAQQKLSGQGRPDVKQLKQLSQQCRQAKERLLAKDAPDEIGINVLGSGSALIGGTRQTRLTQKETQQLALDGFFPDVEITAKPKQRVGALVQTGLPYPADAAITRHLASFLTTHSTDDALPDALLLNGSPFLSTQLSDRILHQVSQWYGEPVTRLASPAPDLAVARGAAYHGWLHARQIQLIRSDTARSYFAIVDSTSGKQAICIMPRGTPANTALTLSSPTFKLRCGQPVQFSLASDNSPTVYPLGHSLADNQQLHHLPPLSTELDGQGLRDVRLNTTLTELGELRLVCQSTSDIKTTSQNSWPLSFSLRAHEQTQSSEQSESNLQIFAGDSVIAQVFGGKSQAKKASPMRPAQLKGALEKALGDSRHWSGLVSRQLADRMLSISAKRRRSEKHESVWFNLTGFALRPGTGMPDDQARIEQLWPLYQQALQYQKESQGWREWWILWRRVAAGLDQNQQLTLLDDIGMVLVPGFARSAGGKAKQQAGIEERIRLIGALERIPVEIKTQLGELLLDKLTKSTHVDASAWALARIGARKLAYASSEHRIDAATTNEWLAQLLKLDWKQFPAIAFPAAAMARLCDDEYQVSAELRAEVATRLKRLKHTERWLCWLSNTEDETLEDQRHIWGDSLPSGLSLSH